MKPNNSNTFDVLLDAARQAARCAYAPYSKFHVGAAILTRDDAIIPGCNVENASYGLTICAERVAATQAIAQGKKNWQAIAVVSPTCVSPCGACRQFLAEFGLDLVIVLGYLDRHDTMGPFTLGELLPMAMRLNENQ